jgi:hypothetical protein
MCLVTGCIRTIAVGQQALQLIMQSAAADATLEQQRLVLAPWLALTGRCLLAQVQLLCQVRELATPPPLHALKALMENAANLGECLLQLSRGLACWTSGFSSSSSGTGRASTSDAKRLGSIPKSLVGLQQQLQADKVYAAAGGRAVIAAASAAAASTVRHIPVYCDLQDTGVLSARTMSAWLHVVLGSARDRMSCLDATFSSSSSSGSFSTNAELPPEAHLLAGVKVMLAGAERQAISVATTCQECWGCVTTCDTFGTLIGSLDRLGLLLCNQLPMPWLCNNPQCANLSGVSELQLVGGKPCVCGG